VLNCAEKKGALCGILGQKVFGSGRLSNRLMRRRKRIIAVAVIAIVAISLVGIGILLGKRRDQESIAVDTGIRFLADAKVPDWVDVQLIDIDGTSRRGELLEDIESIVVHYIGNPGTTAQQNRSYFSNADSTVSAHFIVGLDGEVIQCIPLNEKSSASNWRNFDTISIEVCHEDETGEFSQITYDSLVRLTAWLCELCGFDKENIIRHYDVTGKECPLYFVENEDLWEKFKGDVMECGSR